MAGRLMPEAMLTIADVARELRCSTKTVRRAIAARGLRAFEITDRAWRIRREDLDAWLEQRANPAPREPRIGKADPILPDAIRVPRPLRGGATRPTKGLLTIKPGMGRRDDHR